MGAVLVMAAGRIAVVRMSGLRPACWLVSGLSPDELENIVVGKADRRGSLALMERVAAPPTAGVVAGAALVDGFDHCLERAGGLKDGGSESKPFVLPVRVPCMDEMESGVVTLLGRRENGGGAVAGSVERGPRGVVMV